MNWPADQWSCDRLASSSPAPYSTVDMDKPIICLKCGHTAPQLRPVCRLCGNKEFQINDAKVDSDINHAESQRDSIKNKQKMDAMKCAPVLDESIHKGMAIIGCKIYPPKKCQLLMSAVWENLPSATSNNERSGKSCIDMLNQIRKTYHYQGGPTPVINCDFVTTGTTRLQPAVPWKLYFCGACHVTEACKQELAYLFRRRSFMSCPWPDAAPHIFACALCRKVCQLHTQLFQIHRLGCVRAFRC